MKRKELAEQNIKASVARLSDVEQQHGEATSIVTECFTYGAELLRELGADGKTYSFSEVAAIFEEEGMHFFNAEKDRTEALIGAGYVLFQDNTLYCQMPHQDNPGSRFVASWAARPTVDEIAMEMEQHNDKLHRQKKYRPVLGEEYKILGDIYEVVEDDFPARTVSLKRTVSPQGMKLGVVLVKTYAWMEEKLNSFDIVRNLK